MRNLHRKRRNDGVSSVLLLVLVVCILIFTKQTTWAKVIRRTSCNFGIDIPYRKIERSVQDFTWTLRGGSSNRDYVYNEGDGREDYSMMDDGRRRSRSTSTTDDTRARYDSYPRDPAGMEHELGDGEDDTRREQGEERYYPEEDYEYRRRADYPMDSRSRSGEARGFSQSPSLPNIPEILSYGNKKVGMVFLAGGVVFTMLGISLFFNKGLMRLGNLLFIAGVPLTIGPGRTAGYFLQPRKARATGCLGVGVFFVMAGWPILGIALEVFGLLNLFGNMFPVFMVLLKQLPGLGSILGDGNSERRNKNPRRDYYETDRDRDRYSEDRYEYGGDRRRAQEDDDYRMDSSDRYN